MRVRAPIAAGGEDRLVDRGGIDSCDRGIAGALAMSGDRWKWRIEVCRGNVLMICGNDICFCASGSNAGFAVDM